MLTDLQRIQKVHYALFRHNLKQSQDLTLADLRAVQRISQLCYELLIQKMGLQEELERAEQDFPSSERLSSDSEEILDNITLSQLQILHRDPPAYGLIKTVFADREIDLKTTCTLPIETLRKCLHFLPAERLLPYLPLASINDFVVYLKPKSLKLLTNAQIEQLDIRKLSDLQEEVLFPPYKSPQSILPRGSKLAYTLLRGENGEKVHFFSTLSHRYTKTYSEEGMQEKLARRKERHLKNLALIRKAGAQHEEPNTQLFEWLKNIKMAIANYV